MKNFDFQKAKRKFMTFYRNEDVSKVLIVGIVVLTAVIAYASAGEGGLKAAFLNLYAQNGEPPPAAEEEGSIFRECIWEQNTLYACKPGRLNLAGLNVNLPTKPEIELGNSIQLRPQDPDNPNGEGIPWSGVLFGVAEVDYFGGSASLGSRQVGGPNSTIDYSQYGVYVNRLSYLDSPSNPDRVNWNNQFPQPLRFNGTTEVAGTSFKQDANLLLLMEGLGDNFTIYGADPLSYTNHYSNQEDKFNGIAKQFRVDSGNLTLDTSIEIENTDVATTALEEQVSSTIDFINAIIENLEEQLGLAFAGACTEYGDKYAVKEILENTREDDLPKKVYLTNVGEVYHYDNKEAVCEEYVSRKAEDDIFEVEDQNGLPVANKDFFGIACKPECEECEAEKEYLKCNPESGSHWECDPNTGFCEWVNGGLKTAPPAYQVGTVICSNDDDYKYGKRCPSGAGFEYCKTKDSLGTFVTEVAVDSNGFLECKGGGKGKKAEDIFELNKDGFDKHYAGDVCKVNETSRQMEGRTYEAGELFKRDSNNNEEVLCKLNSNDKPRPDRDLHYWYEDSNWPYSDLQPADDGTYSWCTLNWEEGMSFGQIGPVTFTLDQADLPFGATAAVASMRQVDNFLPAHDLAEEGYRPHICPDINIGVATKTRMAILDTSQCEYFKVVKGSETSYVTQSELLEMDDLPFNQGGDAQMCSPDYRIEPACEYTQEGDDTESLAITQIPTVNSPVSIYTVFPFLGNVIVDFGDKFSKAMFDPGENPRGPNESAVEYVNRVLEESGIQAHICVPGELDIITEYLFFTKVITKEELFELNGIDLTQQQEQQ